MAINFPPNPNVFRPCEVTIVRSSGGIETIKAVHWPGLTPCESMIAVAVRNGGSHRYFNVTDVIEMTVQPDGYEEES